MNNRRIRALEVDAASKLPLAGGTITGELVALGGVTAASLAIDGADAVVVTTDPQRPADAFLRVELNGVMYRIQLLQE